MNRRNLVKLFALSPFYALASRAFSKGPSLAPASPCNCVSVLLHGLFFLEFQNGVLIAASPDHHGHCFRYRDHGGPLGPLPSPLPMVDLTGVLNGGKTVPSYAPENLQFKAADISNRKPFVDLTKQYGLVLQLPYPQNIYALRAGGSGDFHPDPNKNVTKALKVGARIGVITWLQYGPSPNAGFTTRSYYAEHGSLMVPYQEVNQAFGAAQNVLPEFDLRLTGDANSIVATDQRSQLPSEIDPDDERALGEMDINNCSTFNVTNRSASGQKLRAGKSQGVRVGNKELVRRTAVEVATCPQFGIIS